MRLVLSRKGFDSAYGRCPSPILPDGRMISIPIPGADGDPKLSSLTRQEISIGNLVHDVTKGRTDREGRLYRDMPVHLDPDLDAGAKLRLPGWRPAFGQIAGDGDQLVKRSIGPGDVFLFFGWFRRVECIDGRWKYARHAPNLHVLFGYLQVGEVLRGKPQVEAGSQKYRWLIEHPHAARTDFRDDPKNTIYVASEKLTLGRGRSDTAGAGIFPNFREDYQLTWPGHSRSYWRLPRWFYPEGGKQPMSYHADLTRWSRDGEWTSLQSVRIGQDFILDCHDYPEAESWLWRLIEYGQQSRDSS